MSVLIKRNPEHFYFAVILFSVSSLCQQQPSLQSCAPEVTPNCRLPYSHSCCREPQQFVAADISGFTVPRHITVEVKQNGSSVRHHTFITCTAQFTRTCRQDKPSAALDKWRVQGRDKTHSQKPIWRKQTCFCIRAVQIDNWRMAKFVSLKISL